MPAKSHRSVSRIAKACIGSLVLVAALVVAYLAAGVDNSGTTKAVDNVVTEVFLSARLPGQGVPTMTTDESDKSPSFNRDGVHAKQVYALSDVKRSNEGVDSRPLARSREEWLSRIAADAVKAMGGDNEAARRLADVSSASDLGGGKLIEYGSTSMPEGVVNDRLYWLRLAASRGDVVSQYMFAADVYNAERSAAFSPSVPASLSVSLQSEAVNYLVASAKAGLADAMYLLSRSYRGPFLGLPYDAVRSHAWLIALERNYATPETKQLLDASAKNLRLAELVSARTLATTELPHTGQ